MAENKKKKQPSNPLVGSQAQPTTLDTTTTLDIDTTKSLPDNIIEAGLSHKLDVAALENFTSISNARDQIYQLIDTMSQDSSVAAILRTYTEDVCEPADNGHVIWCESDDPKISKYINYILNIMNADKNMYSWTYSLLKYGDVYLRLYRESDYADDLFKPDNIDKAFSARNVLNEDYREKVEEAVHLNLHPASDPYSYYLELVDDPGTMFELSKFGKTYGYIEVPNDTTGIDSTTAYSGVATSGMYNFRMKSADVNVYQADDFVHACLEDNFTRFPETVELFLDKDEKKSQSYSVRRGKSLLYDSYKIWREKALLENAALLNRITRSSIVRKVGVEVGDMPKEQVQQTLRRVKEMMEQKGAINVGNSMSEYNNPGPIENNIYFATHGGQGNITVEAVGGDVEVKNLADLDWWNNKFYSSYGIPKQYFGWCLSKDTEILLLDGSTHTIEELYRNKDKFIGKGIMGVNKDGSLQPTAISEIILTNPHAKTLLEIELDNGKTVKVTPEHRMMLRDGSFMQASELVVGDSLMPYYDKVQDGRRFVLDNKLGKYRPQYRIVAEDAFDTEELKGKQVHHKNSVKINDDLSNLVPLTIKEHYAEHCEMLHKQNKEANKKKRAKGNNVNANVGSKYITNGIYYTTLKAGETLPEGFWYEGPRKPDTMKQAISKLMCGKAKNYDNTSHLNTDEVKAKSLAARQATYDAQTGYKDFLIRCPECGKIITKHFSQEQYESYLNKDEFIYCSNACCRKFSRAGRLNKSLKLLAKEGLENYEQARVALPDGNRYLTEKLLIECKQKVDEYVPEVNHKITKITVLDNLDEPVYDLTVAHDCHTFALPAGIFVHNCDDGAGFNGGTSLTILSSVYAKGVKRVQNSMIQAITDAVNLFLISKGLKSYLNNFTLKMKAPITQEEIDYRADLSNKINAISSMQGLFTDIEDKPRRLKILKVLLNTLNYGDEINTEIDAEIVAAEELAAEEAAAAAAEADGEEGSNEISDTSSETVEETSETAEDTSGGEEDFDLGSLDALEGFKASEGTTTLLEEQELETSDILLTEDDLPSPEELNAEKDFSENN